MSFVSDTIGGVTDAFGLTDHAGDKRAAEQAAAAQQASNLAADRSYSMSKEEIEFQREQYNDWKAIYGDLQEDLGTYYKNITGGTIASQQLQEIQSASQQAQLQIDQELAQRGLTGSGLEASATTQNILSTAQQKASARAGADEAAAQQKLGFLGVGLGQGTDMLGINASVSNTGVSSQGSQASSFLGSSVGYGSNSASISNTGTSNLTGIAKTGISSIFSDKRLKKNLQLVNTVKGIKFYTWTWNKLANELGLFGDSFGVIAQEIQETIPNSIVMREEYLSVDYSQVLDFINGRV